METIKLHLREVHLYMNGGVISPVEYTAAELEEGDRIELSVVDGVVYTPMFGNHHERILAPVVETPSELRDNPHFKLVEIEIDKKEK